MIELKNIIKTFHAGTVNEVKALDRINVTFNRGEFAVLIGSNGSGKSTLMNAIAGAVSVDEGDILIEGVRVNRLKEYQRSKWIARIFQNPLTGTAPDLSIIDNFRLAALRTQPKTLKTGTGEKFKNLVREKISMLHLGLENKIEQAMGTLSGGQRQALTLLMAVMDDSKILLMDEPAAALDPKTSENLMRTAEKLLSEFNLTAILVTHSLKDAHQFGSRIIQMKEGKIIRDLKSAEKEKIKLAEMVEWF